MGYRDCDYDCDVDGLTHNFLVVSNAGVKRRMGRAQNGTRSGPCWVRPIRPLERLVRPHRLWIIDGFASGCIYDDANTVSLRAPDWVLLLEVEGHNAVGCARVEGKTMLMIQWAELGVPQYICAGLLRDMCPYEIRGSSTRAFVYFVLRYLKNGRGCAGARR